MSTIGIVLCSLGVLFIAAVVVWIMTVDTALRDESAKDRKTRDHYTSKYED